MSIRRPLPIATVLAALAVAASGFASGRLVGRLAVDRPDPSTAAAQSAPGPVYAVPVLDVLGHDDVCETWLAIQNVGRDATQAVLVVVGGAAPGEDGDPRHSFPIGVMCTGLIRPGASWHLAGALIPSMEDPNPPPTPGGGSFGARQRIGPSRTGRRAALVFSVAPARLADVLDDPDGTADDDVAANRLCELLHFYASANNAAWSDFLAAWWSGQAWHDLPLGAIAGAPLQAQVRRACPGSVTPGVDMTTGYDAPRVPFADVSAYRVVVPGLVGQRTGLLRNALLYVQNVGRLRASVVVRFQAEGDCTADPSERTMRLQPGDAGVVQVADIVEDGWQGLAIVESDQPIVVASEVIVGDNATVDVQTAAAVGSAEAAGPRFASIVLDANTHTVSAHVVNAGTTAVRPRLTVRDGTGAVVGTAVEGETLCPGGGTTLRQTIMAAVPVGSAFLVRVDAVGDDAGAAQLAATVEVATHSGLLGGGPAQDYALAARTVAPAADAATMAPLAVPGAMSALESSGLDVDLGVSLVGDVAGTLVYSVLAYDHNGLVGGACRMIEGGQSALVSVSELHGLPRNIHAAAVIQATAWHPAPGAVGPAGALIASVFTRKGTFASQGVPGDEISAALALPIEGETAAVAASPPCDAVPEPRPAPAGEGRLAQAVLFAPTISYVGLDDVCLAAVRVTNHDSTPSQVVAITFYEPGFFDPECSGPQDAVCSPLIAPGASWDFMEQDVGGNSSAVVVGFKGASLDALGLVPGETRTAAEIVCEAGDLIGTCAPWRRFALALRTGGPVHDFRMADVAAPISAVVARSCDSVTDPRAKDVANYDAVPLADVVRGQTRPDRYVYTVSRAYASVTSADAPSTSREGVIYVQNAGERSVSVGFTLYGDDGSVEGCSVLALNAGESYAHYLTDCSGPEWQGWVSIAADGPLAVMTDVELDPVTSRASTAGGNRCDVNADGAVDGRDLAAVYAADGSATGGARWNARADLDLSGTIDVEDARIAAACQPGATPTVVDPVMPRDPTPTLWFPRATPGDGGTPGPNPTVQGHRVPLFLPYGCSNRRR